MKLLDLPKDQQASLLTALLRFAYPLYCTTDVEEYDYHFIGSCFPISHGERVFFVFTHHQYKLADGKTILIAFPEDTEKLIGVESEHVATFEDFDLAVFEFSVAEVRETLHMLDASLISKPDVHKEFEYAALGCQRAMNAVNYETKEIVVKKGALITDVARLDHDQSVFDFSGVHLIAGTQETLLNLNNINDQTQGMSGSPVVAFTVNDSNNEKGNLDLHLVGISTHVSETEKRLYAAHPMELVTALQHAFNLFPGHESN